MTERQRVFFALWPDAAVAAALYGAARRIHAQTGGRLMRRDGLHLTLAFLGEQPAGRVEALRRLAASMTGEAFELLLSHAGAWQRGRIVWSGPGAAPPALAALAEGLAGALRAQGFEVERRPFAAHVTLVRNALAPPPPEVEPPVRWLVGEFALVRSHVGTDGARYEVIGRWPLPAPDGDAAG
ncbi:RNA 2',3'-cyclic phosphodiesterase [Thauera sinica]|uniref:RNA 2',3'-cyclic phosphodiesterase n=1 Tax=Thauera sinica TaxID=2665146 RepID=A0ABW1AW81_9RHOO|nr:RNA 2',3'-cyclic phosphodiesterase [Thauera sp. K11]ATE60241.1 RNA 2',3'-cyclic phosphodiesterase [Thauera sp. K11]